MPTQEMIANSLIKVLLSAKKHDFFVRMTDIKDQKDLLASIKREKYAL